MEMPLNIWWIKLINSIYLRYFRYYPPNFNKCHISIFGEVEIKKSKMWGSRFQVDLTSNLNLFSKFLSLY